MHIEYRITEKDYKAAALLAMRKRTSLSSLDFYGPYAFGIVWVAAILLPAYLHPDQDVDLLLTLGVVPILMGFIALRRKRIRREYEKAKQFHLLHQLDLDATGLRLITSAGTTRSAWTVYNRFVEDAKTFLLFLEANTTFFPIPKTELTIAQIDELRSLLSARLREG